MGQARLPGCSGYCSFLLIGALRAGIAFSPPEFTDGLFPRRYLCTQGYTTPLSHGRTHPTKKNAPFEGRLDSFAGAYENNSVEAESLRNLLIWRKGSLNRFGLAELLKDFTPSA